MYDHVIIGAGSAGCVLAARLSEDPHARVLLLEAGPPDTNDLIHIPAAFSALFRTEQDWDHSTVWEPQLHNRRVYLPRGKTLGGSSSLNAMIYIRGNRVDYDEWRDELGCPGWGYDELLPYFKRAEDNERGASELHGAGGPLSVTEGRARTPMAPLFLQAAQAYGLAANEDFNGPSQDGVGWYQVTHRNGARASAAVCYLHPVMQRPNLEVRTRCHVLKLLFEGTRAVGAAGIDGSGEQFEVRAGREVIVSCGAYDSPKLLMLSGIGRPEELELLQIETVAECPEIGANLQDHPNTGCVWLTDREDSLFGALNDDNLARFQSGEGPLTSNVAEVGGFMRTRGGLAAPDVQMHFAAAMFAAEGLVPADAHGLACGACVLKPRSRGYVAVGSPDPTAKPVIVHNYFDDPNDLRTAIDGVRAVMDIARHSPLAECISGSLFVPASDSDADIEAHVRATTQTLYHPVGTCRMGSDETSVLDPALRVRGVEALRVVDASVMPTVPRGNTNAPTIAVAERAADLIRGVEPLAPAAPKAATAAV
ncbi:MAG: FAD-dependent oxidoreductase [Actinobacteria bacterium]|nr:MAG: FAD-dependent oxidoreductase [Actinomycetota bacterium]